MIFKILGNLIKNRNSGTDNTIDKVAVERTFKFLTGLKRIILEDMFRFMDVLKDVPSYQSLSEVEQSIITKELLLFELHICERLIVHSWFKNEARDSAGKASSAFFNSAAVMLDSLLADKTNDEGAKKLITYIRLLKGDLLTGKWLGDNYEQAQSEYYKHNILGDIDDKKFCTSGYKMFDKEGNWIITDSLFWVFARKAASLIGRNDFDFQVKLCGFAVGFYDEAISVRKKFP